MRNSLAALAAIAVFSIFATPVPVLASGVPGCNQKCQDKCSMLQYPHPQFPNRDACVAFWIPRNLEMKAAKQASAAQARKDEAAFWAQSKRF